MSRKLAFVSAILVILLIFIALATSIYWYGWPDENDGRNYAAFSTGSGEAGFACEVADSPAEWTKGLSGRDEMAADEGMIFVWPTPSQQTFWMKECLIPLDIVFIWANGTVGAIYEAPVEPGVSESHLTRYESPGPVKWVVELNMGACEANGIVVGAQLSIRF